ncbi:MAG: type II toxin-antitoxin system RelE/ParE family toxin [Zoogloeaceae bacterium]|jgi:toxin ParE1/3/4|nr:type II toxin-antitoxin system RelE/ParE family toxin [Zoogloeaceae bacterium]
MKARPVIPRALAQQDVDEALDCYLDEDAAHAAPGFIDALERACAHIGPRPATGSPRYAHALDLPGLRDWPLKRYPYIVFCLEHNDHIDVWRVPHSARDISAWCGKDAETSTACGVKAPTCVADAPIARRISG